MKTLTQAISDLAVAVAAVKDAVWQALPPKNGVMRRRNWGLEYYFFQKRAGIGIHLAWDDDIMAYIAIPFLFTVYLWVVQCPITRRLPGQRSITLDFRHEALRWKLWVHEGNYDCRDGWRRGSFYPSDFWKKLINA